MTMFTGLVESLGTVSSLSLAGKSGRLAVKTSLPLKEIAIGDSIAVNGACLTVAEKSKGTLFFDVLNETLKRTTLGASRAGAVVNLERALRFGDRLGGHLVSGHIDGTAPVSGIKKEAGGDIRLTIRLPAALKPLLIPKGSIAVNGISLTIAELGHDSFTVCIIPHTWEATNLSCYQTGDKVNLESDMLGKYILRWQSLQDKGGVSMDDLAKAGFLG
jgi:riboflavin synthase